MDAYPQQESRSRVCTVNDLPWVLSLAHRRYTKTPDPGTTLDWLIRVLNSPATALALRTDNAFCVAMINIAPWWPTERGCHIAVLVADRGYHWDAVFLLKETIRWAEAQGCVRWELSSETDYDFAALAKRVGAKPWVMKYAIDLGGE